MKFKNKPKFIQFSVLETNKLDYRQARAVLKYRPDIIIFENAAENFNPETLFNKFDVDNKPLKEAMAIQKNLTKASKKFKDALSDVETWKNIMQLWKEGHNVLVYNVDAPREMRREFFEVWRHMYPCASKNWLWVASRFYIRETIMAEHVKNIINKYKTKTNPTVLICLQKTHWIHVKFLLNNTVKTRIWKYYFGKFKEISPKNISDKIKTINTVIYKYWKRCSIF